MNLDSMTIGEAREIAALFNQRSQCSSAKKHGLCIVIADRGHVWVGEVSTESDWCYIDKASAVRLWGTKNGLGELAADGPRKETKLDPVPQGVRLNMRALIALIPCQATKWNP